MIATSLTIFIVHVPSPTETASVAILYMQLFYLEQSYLENEREMLCCAALFVAGKLLYQRSRVHDYCVIYFRLKHWAGSSQQASNPVPMPPITEDQKKEFQDRFFAMECKLLRTIDFKLDLEACLPNCTYIKTFARCLYSAMVG